MKDIDRITIRNAHESEIDEILVLFDQAKHFMRRNGNRVQWTGAYPDENSILKDIANGNFYVAEDEHGRLQGCFALIIGRDPTYDVIEGGKWLDDTLEYGTIHRMTSTGYYPRLADRFMSFAFRMIDNVRIDTHECNLPMLNVIRRNGFDHCGVIYVADGTPRLAFQKIMHNNPNDVPNHKEY